MELRAFGCAQRRVQQRRSSELARCLGRLLDNRATASSCNWPKSCRTQELSDSLVPISHAVTKEVIERLQALGPKLFEFRALLTRGWNRDTAYPESVRASHWNAGNPEGQCGVSSVWLAEVLDRDYSIPSIFCFGSLSFDDDAADDVLDHCWLEIVAESGEELVVDLTCDQASGFDREIVFDWKRELDRERIYYIASDRVDISDLPHNPVWPRYQRLLLNLR